MLSVRGALMEALISHAVCLTFSRQRARAFFTVHGRWVAASLPVHLQAQLPHPVLQQPAQLGPPLGPPPVPLGPPQALLATPVARLAAAAAATARSAQLAQAVQLRQRRQQRAAAGYQQG